MTRSPFLVAAVIAVVEVSVAVKVRLPAVFKTTCKTVEPLGKL